MFVVNFNALIIYNKPLDQEVNENTDKVFECGAVKDPREATRLSRNGWHISFVNESRFLYSDTKNTFTIIRS